MKLASILKKHKIKIRGLEPELWNCDEVQNAFKTVAEYATTNQGLQTTVKALQAELDRQKLRANELQIRLNEANSINQKLSEEATDERKKTEWMERKVLVLKNRIEELEDHAVNHFYSNDLYTKQ